MSYYTLHGFVFFVQLEAFLPVQLQKIIAHLSMGVNILTLNKYMIKSVIQHKMDTLVGHSSWIAWNNRKQQCDSSNLNIRTSDRLNKCEITVVSQASAHGCSQLKHQKLRVGGYTEEVLE